ncbi:MAG: FMN-binding glutamate synthase family protein [Dethiobacter sp.]|jgi:glutamate synthase domain-containing protein 2|nr:FMN-binding glutamate synthase family protein [Dethiobacter sp.]
MEKHQMAKAFKIGAAAAAGAMAASILTRRFVNNVHDKAVKKLIKNPYDKNMFELISSGSRIGLQTIVETDMRATEGKVLARPMGSPKKFPNLDDLMFNISQLYVMPTPLEQTVDTRVTIGKKAAKPFVIDMPIMIAPMAYGEALSRQAKVALARGASMAGISNNTGEGPFLPEERKAARYLIYQYHRGDWDKTPQIMSQCDGIEIQLGQGAIGGVGHVLKAKNIDRELRKAYRYPKGKDAVTHSRQPEVQRPQDLEKLVKKLRKIGDGIPIGIKMAAGKHLEADLEWMCNAGVDYIAMEGAEAATKGSAPILQDDFGVPLIFAISRATDWLEKHNFKDSVSLIAAGRIRTPGDMLKACALGADACYIGAIAIFAMSHIQVIKPLPFEPPTQLVWYKAKYSGKFNVDQGAKALHRFLISCKEEMDEAIKALGKTAIKEVNREDLMALTELAAKGCQLPMVYEPFLH